MKKILLIVTTLALSGCIDLGRVGMHPEVKTAYFDGSPYAAADCLYSAALSQHFSLMRDENYSEGSERYNLQDANYENVAWVEFSRFSNKQTSVFFYYAPHAPDVTAAITAMISECKKTLG